MVRDNKNLFLVVGIIALIFLVTSSFTGFNIKSSESNSCEKEVAAWDIEAGFGDTCGEAYIEACNKAAKAARKWARAKCTPPCKFKFTGVTYEKLGCRDLTKNCGGFRKFLIDCYFGEEKTAECKATVTGICKEIKPSGSPTN